MDFKRMKSYFAGGESVDVFVGISLIILGIISFPMGIIIGGVVCILVGIAALCMGYGALVKKMSDDEYDSAVARCSDSLIRSHAFSKLGVDKSEVNEIAPIFLSGYDFEETDEIKVKQGKDNLWRSNIYKTIALFFSRNELHCYTIKFLTTENYILGEETEVYFYQDIVSASTASVNNKITVKGQKITINSEAFRLTTKGGTFITVNIVDSRRAQESVNAMRALLREKKSS